MIKYDAAMPQVLCELNSNRKWDALHVPINASCYVMLISFSVSYNLLLLWKKILTLSCFCYRLTKDICGTAIYDGSAHSQQG